MVLGSCIALCKAELVYQGHYDIVLWNVSKQVYVKVYLVLIKLHKLSDKVNQRLFIHVQLLLEEYNVF